MSAISQIVLRGGIKIENRENLGQCPNGGVGKKTKMSQFQFGNFENRGGSLFFKNVPIVGGGRGQP